MDAEARLIELQAQMEQMKSQMAEAAAARASMGAMPLLEETACYGLASLDVDDGCFIVRWCEGVDGNASGQWEILLPPGCVAVGGSCEALNRPASETSGHEDEEHWCRLNLDESKGSVFTQGEKSFRRWNIVVHAKTSAKKYGVDGLNAAAKRYMYVTAEPQFSGEAPEEERRRRAKDRLGDEFSRTVAVAYKDTSGDYPRHVDHVTSNAINVAAAPLGNFRLVWYFSVDSSGVLDVEKVYCVANELSAAGMVLKGDDMVDVSAFAEIGTLGNGEKHEICAKIRTNENNPGENIVEVVVDATPDYSDDFMVWLRLYTIDRDGNVTDGRSQSLTNVQIYR